MEWCASQADRSVGTFLGSGVVERFCKRVNESCTKQQMQALHTAFSIKEMNIPGWRLHPLNGDKEGQWAIQVSGNWRIVFEYIVWAARQEVDLSAFQSFEFE